MLGPAQTKSGNPKEPGAKGHEFQPNKIFSYLFIYTNYTDSDCG